uniref:Lysine transporter LysE n=1 Tax=Archaeoglobus fulgidus TaxID=2234 RepID=A0A7J2TI19_ARCFL
MIDFIFKVAAISSSGALAPGPLSAVTAAIGTKEGWRGGFKVSIGHFIVEAPLIFFIAFLLSIATIESIMKPLAAVGGIFLIFFGYLTIKSASADLESRKSSFSPIMTGILLTAFNPFFIVWWFSIGGALIAESIILFGNLGALFLLFSHVWIDFVWLSAIAYFTSLNRLIRFQRALLTVLGILVIFFGLDYLYFVFFDSHLI